MRIQPADEATASTNVKTFFDDYRRRLGYVPNIMKCSSLQPEVMLAHHALYRATMFSPGRLSRVERELLAVAVSHANNCHY